MARPDNPSRWLKRARVLALAAAGLAIALYLTAYQAGIVAVSALLVNVQAFVLRSFCTLCLASACLSFVIARLARKEVAATLFRPWQAPS